MADSKGYGNQMIGYKVELEGSNEDDTEISNKQMKSLLSGIASTQVKNQTLVGVGNIR